MKPASILVLASLALAGCATGPNAEDHAAHHPPEAAAATVPTPAQMDRQMKAMQEMHDRMRAARTPEERAALMDEHMKLMQDGMAMMGRMRGGRGGMGMGMMGGGGMGMGMGMGMGPEMMGRRMDMMEMMMQMMMDREATKPPAGR